MAEDLYAVIGVVRDATADEIKSAYRNDDELEFAFREFCSLGR